MVRRASAGRSFVAALGSNGGGEPPWIFDAPWFRAPAELKRLAPLLRGRPSSAFWTRTAGGPRTRPRTRLGLRPTRVAGVPRVRPATCSSFCRDSSSRRCRTCSRWGLESRACGGPPRATRPFLTCLPRKTVRRPTAILGVRVTGLHLDAAPRCTTSGALPRPTDAIGPALTPRATSRSTRPRAFRPTHTKKVPTVEKMQAQEPGVLV